MLQEGIIINYPFKFSITRVFLSITIEKVDPNEAVGCLLKAIDIYTDMGRFTMAAKHHQSIAEMYENEANDLVSEN